LSLPFSLRRAQYLFSVPNRLLMPALITWPLPNPMGSAYPPARRNCFLYPLNSGPFPAQSALPSGDGA
jgi:hypothetical protein